MMLLLSEVPTFLILGVTGVVMAGSHPTLANHTGCDPFYGGGDAFSTWENWDGPEVLDFLFSIFSLQGEERDSQNILPNPKKQKHDIYSRKRTFEKQKPKHKGERKFKPKTFQPTKGKGKRK